MYFLSSSFTASIIFCLVTFLILNHVVFSPCILVMDVLSKHGDRESSHDTSVVTSHVDHVVGLGIFSVFSVSSLGYDVANLLLITFWRSVCRLFPKYRSVHRVVQDAQ